MSVHNGTSARGCGLGYFHDRLRNVRNVEHDSTVRDHGNFSSHNFGDIGLLGHLDSLCNSRSLGRCNPRSCCDFEHPDGLCNPRSLCDFGHPNGLCNPRSLCDFGHPNGLCNPRSLCDLGHPNNLCNPRSLCDFGHPDGLCNSPSLCDGLCNSHGFRNSCDFGGDWYDSGLCNPGSLCDFAHHGGLSHRDLIGCFVHSFHVGHFDSANDIGLFQHRVQLGKGMTVRHLCGRDHLLPSPSPHELRTTNHHPHQSTASVHQYRSILGVKPFEVFQSFLLHLDRKKLDDQLGNPRDDASTVAVPVGLRLTGRLGRRGHWGRRRWRRRRWVQCEQQLFCRQALADMTTQPHLQNADV